MFFFRILLSRTLIVISSPSWIAIWIGLEINLLSFIPLINDKNNPLSSERIIKYFIVQALASTILIFSLLNSCFNPNLILVTSISIKLGLVPFHFWYPIIIEGISWINCLILSTWQKIRPLIVISYLNFSLLVTILVLLTNFTRRFIRMNFSSLRKLMAFSSLNNIRWIIPLILISKPLWIIYLLMYFFVSLRIIILFKTLNISFINQIFYSKQKFNWGILSIIRFFSIAGLPPFLGFIPKWISIQELISEKFFLIALILILSTILLIFSYTRIIFSSILLFNNEKSWNLFKLHCNSTKIIFINIFCVAPWTFFLI